MAFAFDYSAQLRNLRLGESTIETIFMVVLKESTNRPLAFIITVVTFVLVRYVVLSSASRPGTSRRFQTTR